MKTVLSAAAAVLAAPMLFATPAAADTAQAWLNANFSKRWGATSLTLEPVHRFRPASDGGDQTQLRLTLEQRVADGVTIGGGVTGVWTPAVDEQRIHQQISLSSGIFRARTRLEQRFVDGQPRTGWRLRQRIGVEVPVGANDWSLTASSEGFFVVRATRAGGDTGLTALRTMIGAKKKLGGGADVALGYVNQRTVIDGAADRNAHAPYLTFGYSF